MSLNLKSISMDQVSNLSSYVKVSSSRVVRSYSYSLRVQVVELGLSLKGWQSLESAYINQIQQNITNFKNSPIFFPSIHKFRLFSYILDHSSFRDQRMVKFNKKKVGAQQKSFNKWYLNRQFSLILIRIYRQIRINGKIILRFSSKKVIISFICEMKFNYKVKFIEQNQYKQVKQQQNWLKIQIMASSGEDYKQLYQMKCLEFEQISQQFNQLQQQSTLIMNDMEDQIKEIKRKNQLLERQVKDLKQKKRFITSTIERELDQAQKEKNEFKNNFKIFEKKVIELEIINEDLQNQLRATKSTLEEYQASSEKTMEELAILRVELEESTNANQQQIARLRQQLKQTEEQISVMHKKTKKNDSETNVDQIPSQKNIQKEKILDNAKTSPQCLKRSESGLIQNISQPIYKKDIFKQTLRDIRDYLQSIDVRKDELKKTLLISKQYLAGSNY